MSGTHTDTVTEAAIRAVLHTAELGRTLSVEPTLPSTNTCAWELADRGAPHGTAVIADTQTAGHGRRGRSFFSPAGGVYMSVLLRPDVSPDPGLLTSCAAVAAARAIESLCPLTVSVKWVNDLLIGGRKVCGILAQGRPCAAEASPSPIVLGIGINVAPTRFPPELERIATSLGNEGYPVDRARLIARVLEELETALATAATGDFLAESRRRSAVLGRRITVLRSDGSFPATVEEIDSRGRLIVRTDSGERLILSSGEVSLRLD